MFVSQATHNEVLQARDNAVASVTALTEQLQTANQQLAASVQSDNEARQSLATANTELTSAQGNLATANASLETANGRITELESSLQSSTDALAAANTELAGLRGQTPPPSKPGASTDTAPELSNREKAKAALDVTRNP